MKKLSLLIVLSMLVSCGSSEKGYVKADHVTKLYKDSTGQLNITGRFMREDLLRPAFSEWYNAYYDSYVVKPDVFRDEKLRNAMLKDVYIEVFMGTWCEDSHREVPNFLKILDALNFESDHLALIGVNRQKKAFYGWEIGKRIEYVPTFIFYKKRKMSNQKYEVGRIIEAPTVSLEEDMYRILNGVSYTSNHSNENDDAYFNP